MECEYGPGVSTSATVHLDYGPAQIQTCPLLPRGNYQSILPGTGETERRHPFGSVPAISLRTIQVQYCVLFCIEDVELYQNKCNFPSHLSKCTTVSVAWGRLAVEFVLWQWYHLECLTHAALFTCLCFSRSSDCFCGDKSEWHICGIGELHHLWLREDWSNTPQDGVSHTSIVSALYLKFWIYSGLVELGRRTASLWSFLSKFIYSHTVLESTVGLLYWTEEQF